MSRIQRMLTFSMRSVALACLSLAALLGSGVAIAAPVEQAGVLYDQMGGASTNVESYIYVYAGGYTCSSGGAVMSGNDDRRMAADDFAVPAGQTWGINQVEFAGGSGGLARPYEVTFYADANGVPGSVVGSFSAQASGAGPFSITLAHAVTLGAGKYWLSVRANFSQYSWCQLGSQPSWGWASRAAQSGSPAAWMTNNPRVRGAQTNCYNKWAARTTCGVSATTPDQVFRLSGSRIQGRISASPEQEGAAGAPGMPRTGIPDQIGLIVAVAAAAGLLSAGVMLRRRRA